MIIRETRETETEGDLTRGRSRPKRQPSKSRKSVLGVGAGMGTDDLMGPSRGEDTVDVGATDNLSGPSEPGLRMGMGLDLQASVSSHSLSLLWSCTP